MGGFQQRSRAGEWLAFIIYYIHIWYYVQKNSGNATSPSQKALLALFLYQHREELLSSFLDSLRFGYHENPSGDSMHFREADMNRLRIPFCSSKAIWPNKRFWSLRTSLKPEYRVFHFTSEVSATENANNCSKRSLGEWMAVGVWNNLVMNMAQYCSTMRRVIQMTFVFT